MKRFYVLMALLLVILMPLAACSTAAPTKTEMASAQASTTAAPTATIVAPATSAAPVSLSVFVSVAPDVTLENNLAVKFIEEKTNLKLSFVKADTTDAKQLMMSSGNYPDCFLNGGFTNLDIMNYGVSQQIFIPLNSLIDNLGTNVKLNEADVPGYLKMATAPDGNIYGLPYISQCFHCQSGKAWINTAWLTKLGLSMPQTTDDLEKVLLAFKTQDPNGNGKADEIPMSGAVKTWKAEPEYWLMNAFIYTDSANFFKVDNGKLSFVANTPEWRDGLRYINKLYKEGLIDPASFTQNLDQLLQLGQNKDVAILGSFAAGHVGMAIDLQDRTRSEQYNVEIPIKGPGGQQNAQLTDMNNVQGASFVITNKCKNPEAAFRLGDYSFSEEFNLVAGVGIEGKQWEKAKAGDLGLTDKPAKWTNLVARMERSTKTIDYTLGIFNKATTASLQSWTVVDKDIYNPASTTYELRLVQATMKYQPYWPKETVPPLYFSTDVSSKIAQYQTSINDYVNQSTVRFITGELSIDTGWDEYVKGIDNLGLADYLSIYQTAMDARAK